MAARWVLAWMIGCLAACLASGDETPAATCALTLSLIDAQTGEPLPGIVQVLDQQGQPIKIAELVNRGQGIEQPGPIHQWWVLSKATTIQVPQAPLVVKALAGLETELADRPIDLSGREHARLEVPLARFYRARREGWLAGNTHLHLMKLSKAQADRYLKEVPLADGLDVVFLSYLERAVADLEYTSNKYSRQDLQRLSHDHVHFGHGQEHRHNFGAYGEGYGHILLLDIPYIVQPVSIGPGIMGSGNDAPPLQEGIDEARRSGGKVIWAHNLYGLEDIPNWLTGRVHANNILDGSHHGSYKDSYYRYLNVGLNVPFSTGTDWFIYDFSRAYVSADGPITPTGWLDRLAAGKSFITNGPLLELTIDSRSLGSTIDSRSLGSTIDLPAAGEVRVRGRATGRIDFGRIELVRNGRVVRSRPAKAEEGHFVAAIEEPLSIGAPSWLALRTPPPPATSDPELQEPVRENEFGGRLFSHTSPIYVRLAGQGVFDRDTARGLIQEMQSSVEKIKDQASFADDRQRAQVLKVYDEAIDLLEKRVQRESRGKPVDPRDE